MKIVTVIQARSGSSRLPGKVLKFVSGKPLLIIMLERVARAKRIGELVVATTESPADDVIADLCAVNGFQVFRGDEQDLLDRHYQVGRKFGADAVVKIPSDCPLIDPAVIDQTIAAYEDQPDAYDYVSNLHPPTHPDGNDVEVIRFSTLELAWKEAKKDFEREHTTPFFWEQSERFRLLNVAWETGLDYSQSHRFVLDYPEDFAFIEAVFNELYANDPNFGLPEILTLLERKPELRSINQKYLGDAWYKHHLDELKTIDPTRTGACTTGGK